MSWLKAKDWATGVEYSNLFHSGLRTISLRPRACRARECSETSSSGGTSSRASLSSRLLRRSTPRTPRTSSSVSTSTDSSPPPSPRAPKVAHPRPTSMFLRPTKEMADAWSSGGLFLEVRDCPEEGRLRGSYLLSPIDPDAVRCLAGSGSFFVNLGEMDVIAVPLVGDESLSDSPDGSPLPRREHPVSMPSRHTSLHCTRRERGDGAWMLEASSPELKAYELDEVEEEMRLDDWRQFHVDWVRNIC